MIAIERPNDSDSVNSVCSSSQDITNAPVCELSVSPDPSTLCQENAAFVSGTSNLVSSGSVPRSLRRFSETSWTYKPLAYIEAPDERDLKEPESFADCTYQLFNKSKQLFRVETFIGLLRMCDGDLDIATYWGNRLGIPKHTIVAATAKLRKVFPIGRILLD